ncbi:MAG: 16S rRNA (cytosine(967)-C(5))-methyltransferase RsmB [Pseudomonadota bacterium]
MAQANPRAAAARAIIDIIDLGRSMDSALPAVRERAGGQYSLTASLVYGVLRHRRLLEHWLSQLLNKPLAKRDRLVHALLLAGLFERWQLATPPHAAVSHSVDALRVLKRPGLKGLTNAVLRRFGREAEDMTGQIDVLPPAVRHSHPDWLAAQLAADWNDRASEVLCANNSRAPMWLRVNRMRTTRQAYLDRLSTEGFDCEPVPEIAAHAVRLRSPVAVADLPGFSEGSVSIQDLAPQLAAPLLEAKPGMRVLDACAAPGGKTAHLQELADNGLDLLALDQDPTRLARVGETLDRLELSAVLVEGDAAQPEEWWDGRPFDRILIDAPCTATGVIRRHPDIKSLRRPSDVVQLVDTQRRILAALWPLLAPGGCLVYATCSILKAENAMQMTDFCREFAPELQFDKLLNDNIKGVMPKPAGGVQLLPGTQGADGFYLSRLWRPA